MVTTAVIAIVAILALGRLRGIGTEVTRTTLSSEVAAKLAAAVSVQIGAAERYLVDRSEEARETFQVASDTARAAASQLGALPRLSDQDRVAALRIVELQVETDSVYRAAQALRDLGGSRQAVETAFAARRAARNLTQAIQEFSGRQSAQTVGAMQRLVADTRGRQALVSVLLVAAIVIGVAVGGLALRSVREPISRLAGAATRASEGDFRPVPLGDMPGELNELAQAMSRIGTSLRSLVTEIASESERIAATAGDLSAVSEEIAASAGQISSAGHRRGGQSGPVARRLQ